MFDQWQRLNQGGRAVYVRPEKPDWLVPDQETDLLLQALLQGRGVDPLRAAQLKALLDSGPVAPYRGRAELLELKQLKECWFHLTDRCNLACRHCLFASSPAAAATLSPSLLADGLAQAKALGCRLFCFTGGEPFLYPGFVAVLADLLADPQNHVVVLSNGLLIPAHLPALATLPRERLHLQLSLDGTRHQHEAIRGKGSFAALLDSLKGIQEAGFAVTLSVAVNRNNVASLAEIVGLAAEHGVKNLHLLWHFVRGKGSHEQFVPAAEILPKLFRAQERAEACGVLIDNVENLRNQILSAPGTRHDLANTAWESLAVGPDGSIYPSPALVGIADLSCGNLAEGLEMAWRYSPVSEAIRQASLCHDPQWRNHPLRFLIGGGDIDHSFLAGGALVGHDPYAELYQGLALWLIDREARRYPARSGSLLLRMGDLRRGCPEAGFEEVSLTHCNCVISLADAQGHGLIRDFYGQAALDANEEIVNPFAPAPAAFIPEEARKKSYGCGSPVQDTEPKPGEVLVDLGSGSGVECFLAAKAVGPSGRVYGIDMTEEMLALARRGKEAVTAGLGYDNLEFRQGFLEAIPLEESSADVVISNCVINLSPDKRRTFHEIFRILKPGGRLVVSDIVSDEAIPPAIRNNRRYRGECLGGALRQVELLAMLEAAGFSGSRLIKRFPYRTEGGTRFYSLTFQADKPTAAQEEKEAVRVIYRGPFAAVWTEAGEMLLKGESTTASLSEAERLSEALFILDDDGAVNNLVMENCCCAPSTEPLPPIVPPTPIASASCDCRPPDAPAPAGILSFPSPSRSKKRERHRSGCMVCGAELSYLPKEREATCHYCGAARNTGTLCTTGHYVCDDCHQRDGLSLIRLLCTETTETDMLRLLDQIRSHPAVPLHGPEHHAMVPGIILATYRNLGGEIDREAILTGIERGSRVPGGVCGFWGSCGAAAGVGIAYSVLLKASPLTPEARQQVQQITSRVLAAISRIRGARCCQRETVTALREAARISGEILPTTLLAAGDFHCRQSAANRECIGGNCPLWSAPTAEALHQSGDGSCPNCRK